MTMSELRRTGKQLHIRGTTCYKKFNESNRALLEEKVRDRVKIPPEEIVLWDKPLQFLRNAIRKSGLKITSDVGETFRADMVRILVERGFVRNSNELLEEAKMVDETIQRVVFSLALV